MKNTIKDFDLNLKSTKSEPVIKQYVKKHRATCRNVC